MIPLMTRWTTLVGTLLLVLMAWTGTSAHAAERSDCIPVTEQNVKHFDGDRDEVPFDFDPGVAHHHAGCSGHQIGAPDHSAEINLSMRSAPLIRLTVDVSPSGREPEDQLRPPIA